MNIKTIFYCSTMGLFCSCMTPRNISYMEDADKIKVIQSDATNYDPKFKVGDCLIISVSAIDPLSVTPFNLPLVTASGQQVVTNMETNSITDRKSMSSTRVMQTYTVDADGTINFPVLGRIQVVDKNRMQLTTDLEVRISKYVDNPIVNIKVDNFKVSVIGEVLRPGAFVVSSDRMSLFDALGLAGDLTIYGDRKSVKVVRDNNGIKEIAHLDLTKTDILDSPYFYLEQNDVVYVEPNNKRKKTSRYSQAEQYNLSMISTVASTLSVIVSVVATILAMNKK